MARGGSRGTGNAPRRRMRSFIFATILLAFAAACGPGDEVDTIDVTTSVVDRAITIEWTVDPATAPQIGTVAVFACDDDGVCPNGRYRHPEVDAPLWFITGESYTECTFPEIVAPVTYGAPPPVFVPGVTVLVEDVAPAALEPGVEHVAVVWRFGGCLGGGPVDAGRATFTAP